MNVFPLTLPPLRERGDDIVRLASAFAQRCARTMGRTLAPLTADCAGRLMRYGWPGNVRELENCLERAAVMSESGSIDADLIRVDRQRETQAVVASPVAASATFPVGDAGLPSEGGEAEPDERARVIAALEQAGWVQARAARILGMTPRQIAYRILTLNIEVKKI